MLLHRTNLHPDTHAGMPRIGFLLALFVLAAVTAGAGSFNWPHCRRSTTQRRDL